ncbi:MAG: hypothetical protein JHC25_03510 [Thermodesulfobacterium sp.]|jgi:hypothetical protein|nr:hypothetical protein [Thermodesulfobacterium sp.]
MRWQVKELKKKELKKVRVWAVDRPPVDPIDHAEPLFRVSAPADWGKDRVIEALEGMGYNVAIVAPLLAGLSTQMWEARFCGVPKAERLGWALNSLGPLIALPSGRKITPKGRKGDGYRRRVEVLPFRYPKADVSVRYFVDSGYHVFQVVATDIPKDLFDRVSTILSRVLEEFIGFLAEPIDYGYEVEIPPHVQLTDLQVRALCKLLHRLTERFLRRGILRYRRRVSSPWVAHPEDYLRLGLTKEEVEAVQSLVRD